MRVYEVNGVYLVSCDILAGETDIRLQLLNTTFSKLKLFKVSNVLSFVFVHFLFASDEMIKL